MTLWGAKMNRVYLSGLTVAMALTSAGCALAEGPETQIVQAMIRDIEFITQNSSLEYGGEHLPEVTVVSEEELQRLFRSSETNASAKKDGRSFALVSALYDRYENRIFLSDLNAIAGPGLFHELVHYLQDINGKEDMFKDHAICLEAEAYDLQAAWQTEQGIDPASKPDYGFITTLYGICNDADFSWIETAFGG
jgi:hypothetical protein